MNYFISDTHFGHENVIRFCSRPFSNASEMNEVLINNWNARVTNNDRIFILGDLFFRCEDPEPILERLKGKKHLIIGNHDSSWLNKADLDKYFVFHDKYLEYNDGTNVLVMFHYPLVSFIRQYRANTYMIHGHIHNNTNADYWPLLAERANVLNAGVDINNFKPVTLNELIENNIKFKEEHKSPN